MVAGSQLFRNVSKMFSKAKIEFPKTVSLVKIKIDDERIALVTLQQPALNLALLQELGKVFDELSNKKCKGMILTSASPTVFSAGLDLMETYVNRSNKKVLDEFIGSFIDVWIKLYGANYITAAAINGHAPGSGCLLAISCEYRTLVNGNTSIGMNETALGLAVPNFMIKTFLNLVPKRQAELALTTSKMFTGNEALKVGLIDEVANDKTDAIEKCRKFIKSFDAVSPMFRAQVKQTIRRDVLQWVLNNRQMEIDSVVNTIMNTVFQMRLEEYISKFKTE